MGSDLRLADKYLYLSGGVWVFILMCGDVKTRENKMSFFLSNDITA